MIIRTYFKCLTCDQPHTLRIGLGLEENQTHRFPCASCGEPMEVRVNLDQQNGGAGIQAIENAEEVSEPEDAPVINLDPNFTIPEGDRFRDGSFSRLELLSKLKSTKRLDTLPFQSIEFHNTRPHRRPDFDREWKLLKKSWSLHRRGRTKLSLQKLQEASKEYYEKEALSDLNDWLFRFSRFLGHQKSEKIFAKIAPYMNSLTKLAGYSDFMKYYQAELRADRATRYFQLMKDFFSDFSEYSQIYFLVTREEEIPDDHHASSINFDRIRSFYGDTYEAFSSSVDILAYLNNLSQGRKYDEFAELKSINKYLQLDKSSRFNPFSSNQYFMALCSERDNQVRNASHHGSFRFDEEKQIIFYKAGKGGTGAEQQMRYIEYLEKCLNIFLQTMTLFSLEMLMCKQSGNQPAPV